MDLYPFVMRRLILPAVARATRIRIWEELRKGMHAERLSLEALRELQFARLREILSHAYERVPFYRDKFNRAGFRLRDLRSADDLLAIPPTTKEEIMAHFPDEITAQGMDRGRWRYVATSGTTRQIMGIHDFEKINVNWAAGLRAHKLAGGHEVGMRWMEIPPHMCTNICGINDQGNPERLVSAKAFSLLLGRDIKAFKEHLYAALHDRRARIYRRITLPSFGSEGTNIPGQDLDAYLRAIRDYRPHLLEGLPLYLYALAKHLIRNRLPPPGVTVIKPFGGSFTPGMKERIREAFACDVFDTYGCSETGFIACDCEKHEGLHLFMDLYHVEVCRNGRLAAPGELGRIYLTDLSNRAMPWIRYDIGDVGRFLPEDHGCGRQSIRIEVEGRLEDTLVNPKGEPFTSDRIFDFFHGFPEVDNFQLLEKAEGRFDLLIVPAPSARVDPDRITRQFQEFFDETATVRTYLVKTIKAEEGGKFRFVKSASFQRLDPGQ